MAENFSNDYRTTLAAGITSGATSLTLTSATGTGINPAPVAPFRIRIGNELILVGARTGTACTQLIRGVEGTTAASHAAGSIIRHILTVAGLTMFVMDGGPGDALRGAIGMVVDGGGVVLSTGTKGSPVQCPYSGTIVAARLFANIAGGVVVDVWKSTYLTFPPTNAMSITAAAPMTITAAQKSEDVTLTGWDVTVAEGDIFWFNIDSISTISCLTIELLINRAI